MKVRRRVLTRQEVECSEVFPTELELTYASTTNLVSFDLGAVSVSLDRDDVGALMAQLERFHVQQCARGGTP